MRQFALAALLGLAACDRGGGVQEEAGETVPALSRAGASWQVSRADRRVFSLVNAPGKIRWSRDETDHPFASGRLKDPREEARLKQLVKQSRHFRDLIHRLERAGYGVSAADAPGES